VAFYENYVHLCNKIGKSPSAVAIELKLGKPSVTRWKSGTKPRDATVLKVANYFHVTVDELVGDALSGKKETLDPKIEGVSPTIQELFDFIDTATDAELNELLRYAQFLMSKR
jgi:hypothetical protein